MSSEELNSLNCKPTYSECETEISKSKSILIFISDRNQFQFHTVISTG